MKGNYKGDSEGWMSSLDRAGLGQEVKDLFCCSEWEGSGQGEVTSLGGMEGMGEGRIVVHV